MIRIHKKVLITVSKFAFRPTCFKLSASRCLELDIFLVMLSLDTWFLAFCPSSSSCSSMGVWVLGEWAGLCDCMVDGLWRPLPLAVEYSLYPGGPCPVGTQVWSLWLVDCGLLFQLSCCSVGSPFISHWMAWSPLCFWWLWTNKSLSHPPLCPMPSSPPLQAMGSVKVPTRALSVWPHCSTLLSGLECNTLAEGSEHWSSKIMNGGFGNTIPPSAPWITLI